MCFSIVSVSRQMLFSGLTLCLCVGTDLNLRFFMLPCTGTLAGPPPPHHVIKNCFVFSDVHCLVWVLKLNTLRIDQNATLASSI